MMLLKYSFPTYLATLCFYFYLLHKGQRWLRARKKFMDIIGIEFSAAH